MELNIVNTNKGTIIYSFTVSGSSRLERSDNFLVNLLVAIVVDENAYDNLASNIRGVMKYLFRLTAQVEDIKDNGDIVLPFGNQYSVKKGQRFRVYHRDDDTSFGIGDIIEDSYTHIGTIRVRSNEDNYSTARVLRPFEIGKFNAVEEMSFAGFTFGLYSTFGTYKIFGYEKTKYSNSGNGKLNISVPELDYSYGVYLGMGATILAMPIILTPTMSLGVLFGDLFETTWGLDVRINLEFQIPVYYEIISISIIPYMSFAFIFSEIGHVSGGDYSTSSYTIKNGSEIRSNDFFFGGGILGTIRFNFTDNVGLSLGAGYKFYMDRINLGTYALYDDGYDSDDPRNVENVKLENTPNYLIDLSGLEAIFSLDFMF